MEKNSFGLTLHDTSVLKGIAICAMLWHHLFYENPEYGYVVWHFAMLGKVCVSIFLLLSGYGLTIQMNKLLDKTQKVNLGGQICHFLLKRYTKFYLNYWVVFLLFVPLGVFCFDRPLAIPYGENANIPLSLAKDFFGLQKFNSYNITWWFNQIIIILWLAFPFLFWLVKNGYARWIVLPQFMIFMPINALAFLLGIYLAQYRENIEILILKITDKVTLAILFVLLAGLCFCREKMLIECLYGINADPYIALTLASLVAIAAKKIKYQLPVLAYLGKHSMNMYMVHTFIFAYFFHNFIYSFQYPLLIFAALLLSSLGVSIVLETLKTKLKFYILVSRITSKISA